MDSIVNSTCCATSPMHASTINQISKDHQPADYICGLDCENWIAVSTVNPITDFTGGSPAM